MSLVARIVLLLALQTAVLVTMVGLKQYTLATGTEILLETRPIDPRSLFRGDYVILYYKVNDLNVTELEGDDDFSVHDPIYVVLTPGNKYWTPVSIHRERPSVTPPQVFIKGRVRWAMETHWDPETQTHVPGASIHVRYGIENYFVPEGEGKDLELRPSGELIDIRVAVAKRGNSGIKAVLVNGEERYVETLF